MNSVASSNRVMRLSALMVIFWSTIFSVTANAAKDPVYTPIFSNLAVSGYDAVAYFEQGAAVKGSKEFSYEWQGAKWRFSSAKNLASFKEDPEAFAPQYGGYCAYAAAINKAVKADPKVWDIRDGKLYLNFNKKIQQDWRADIDDYIEQADKNWPALLE